MLSFPLAPSHGARLLMLARMRVAYSPEQPRLLASKHPILALADRFAPKLSVLVRYAFAMGRKRLPDTDAAIEATASVLRKMLPKMLGEIAEAGAGVEMRVAEFNPDQPRDEDGKWTSEGGGTLYHGTSSKLLPSIQSDGLVAGHTKRKGEIGSSNISGILHRDQSVYLSMTERKARDYADVAAYAHGGHPIVISIAIPKEHSSFVVRDEQDDQRHGSLRFPKNIPASWIKGSRSLEDGSALRTARTTKIDKKTQAARDWATDHAAELIKGLSKTTRERVKAVIAEFVDRPSKMAPALRQALGDADRAEMIARTESMRAAHKGQQFLWQEAQGEGLLDATAKRVWIVTEDDIACPLCQALDGKTALLDDAYDAGDEYVDGPPLHPACRCTEGLA